MLILFGVMYHASLYFCILYGIPVMNERGIPKKRKANLLRQYYHFRCSSTKWKIVLCCAGTDDLRNNNKDPSVGVSRGNEMDTIDNVTIIIEYNAFTLRYNIILYAVLQKMARTRNQNNV